MKNKEVKHGFAWLMTLVMVIFIVVASPRLSMRTEAASKKVVAKNVTAVDSLTGSKKVYLAIGKKATLKTTVTVTPNKSSNKQVKYTSSNESVATVTSKGVITGKKVGTAKITVTSKKNSKKKAIVTVKVVKGKVTSVKLNQTSSTLTVGDTIKLTATVKVSSDGKKNVVWTSSDKNIATVKNGKVTAVASGTATITVKAADGTGKKATCKVTVKDRVTEAITEKAAEVTTEKAAEVTTEKAAEVTTEKSSESATTEKATEATTEKATEATTEKAAEATTEKAAEATTEKAAEATTEKFTESATTEKADSAGAINNSEYSYARLISEKSPLLGYWQGEHAGMYVGYNTSADEEGFIIYLYTSDKWVQILNDYEGYSMTGNMGQINYSKDGSNVDVVVKDESHITINFQSVSYEGDDYISEYTFTKGELDDSLMKQFGGKWNGGLDRCGTSPDFNVTYDEGYHFNYEYGDRVRKCIHEKTKNEAGYYDMPHICLYDGQGKMIFISPRGQYYDEMAFTSYELISESDNNQELILVEGLRGGGGAMCYPLYRDGSEEDKVQKALVAYYNYISNLDKYSENQKYFSYKLVYVDDDDIPELVVIPGNGCIMCTYKDGEVIQLVNSSTSWFNYIEESGYYQYGGMLAGEFCAKLEDGMGEVFAYRMGKTDEGYIVGEYFYIDDAEVSEEDYQDYLDSLPYDYVSATEDMYSSIYEAYENLN